MFFECPRCGAKVPRGFLCNCLNEPKARPPMSEDGVMDELDRAREEMAAQWSTIRDLRSQLAAEREASADLRRQLDERNAELETMYVVTMTLGRLQDNERIAKLLGKVSMIEHEQQEIAK